MLTILGDEQSVSMTIKLELEHKTAKTKPPLPPLFLNRAHGFVLMVVTVPARGYQPQQTGLGHSVTTAIVLTFQVTQ